MPTDQDPALSPIEAALAALAPARSPVDRDRIMFAAGRASARPSRGFRVPWAAVAAGFALISAVEGMLLTYKPAPGVIVRMVAARVPEPTLSPAPIVAAPRVDFGLGRTPYDRLAAQVFRYGLDGLSTPIPAGPGRRSVGSRQMLREELALNTPSGDPS